MASQKKDLKMDSGKDFNSETNPFNFQSQHVSRWTRQIKDAARAVPVNILTVATAEDAARNGWQVGATYQEVVSLEDCMRVESYTKAKAVMMSYQPPTPQAIQLGTRSGGSSSLSSAGDAMYMAEHHKSFEEQRKIAQAFETYKAKAIEDFLALVKKTFLVKAYDDWLKRYMESVPHKDRSVYSMYESLKTVRSAQMLEVLQQKYASFIREEDHIITLEAWQEAYYRKFNDLFNWSEEYVAASSDLVRIRETFMAFTVHMPQTCKFAPHVARGIDEMIKRDTYTEITGEITTANLKMVSKILTACVHRAADGQAPVPIATNLAYAKGSFKSVAFNEENVDEVVVLKDKNTDFKLKKSFASSFEAATGEAKLLALQTLKDGKAKSGENRDPRKTPNHVPVKDAKANENGSGGGSTNKDRSHDDSGRGRGGGTGRGRGRGDGGRGRGRGRGNTPSESTTSNDRFEVIQEDEFAGVVCVTVCKPDIGKPCGSVQCNDCLSNAVTNSLKQQPEKDSRKRPRAHYASEYRVVWSASVPSTSVHGIFRVPTKVSAPARAAVDEPVDPDDEFYLLLDSGSDHSAIRTQDMHEVADLTVYQHADQAPFKASSASGHDLQVIGEGTLSPALRTCYVMGTELVENLLSCNEFQNDTWITLAPRSAGLDWRVYIYTSDGRVIAVADDKLRVFPHYVDAMITGIPTITPPVINNRNPTIYGPSGDEFWMTARQQQARTSLMTSKGRGVSMSSLACGGAPSRVKEVVPARSVANN